MMSTWFSALREMREIFPISNPFSTMGMPTESPLPESNLLSKL